MLPIRTLIDDAKGYQVNRDHRWTDGPRCPHRDRMSQQGREETQPARPRSECRDCPRRFDDLTGTIFAGHHQPLRVWVLGLYFMGLNLSHEQIAQELDLHPDNALRMAAQLRGGVVQRKPEVVLSGEVECGRSTWWPRTRAFRRP
jgi:transposase-like protein